MLPKILVTIIFHSKITCQILNVKKKLAVAPLRACTTRSAFNGRVFPTRPVVVAHDRQPSPLCRLPASPPDHRRSLPRMRHPALPHNQRPPQLRRTLRPCTRRPAPPRTHGALCTAALPRNRGPAPPSGCACPQASNRRPHYAVHRHPALPPVTQPTAAPLAWPPWPCPSRLPPIATRVAQCTTASICRGGPPTAHPSRAVDRLPSSAAYLAWPPPPCLARPPPTDTCQPTPRDHRRPSRVAAPIALSIAVPCATRAQVHFFF